MTIHKSKGKEFDAVIVYEGRYQNRIISKPERREQATLGTATELLTEMKEQEVTPNMVTKYLGQFAYEVLEPLGIEYRTKRTGKSRLIKFLRRDGDDANDTGIAI